MNIEEQDRLITLAEGSVKTLFALCVADIPSNSLFIIEHMHRWLAALIEADYSRRQIIDYFYSWQRDFEGNKCIDEKLREVFNSEADLKGEFIHHSWIDTWIDNG
ncbi:MAG: hypothetical protein DI538_18210 [Azospira oryzae]|jgi:hypothetical protein|nr:MAG: hypothetical protein DI538_18210 [Azospira oryzae]